MVPIPSIGLENHVPIVNDAMSGYTRIPYLKTHATCCIDCENISVECTHMFFSKENLRGIAIVTFSVAGGVVVRLVFPVCKTAHRTIHKCKGHQKTFFTCIMYCEHLRSEIVKIRNPSVSSTVSENCERKPLTGIFGFPVGRWASQTNEGCSRERPHDPETDKNNSSHGVDTNQSNSALLFCSACKSDFVKCVPGAVAWDWPPICPSASRPPFAWNHLLLLLSQVVSRKSLSAKRAFTNHFEGF